MQFAPALAAALLLGSAGLTASAAPLPAQPTPFVGGTVESVDWHPSTRHWDHHFHAHQESLRYHQPAEAERRANRMMRGGDPHARNGAAFGPRYRLGGRNGAYYR